jgi:hypothetical protein
MDLSIAEFLYTYAREGWGVKLLLRKKSRFFLYFQKKRQLFIFFKILTEVFEKSINFLKKSLKDLFQYT